MKVPLVLTIIGSFPSGGPFKIAIKFVIEQLNYLVHYYVIKIPVLDICFSYLGNSPHGTGFIK